MTDHTADAEEFRVEDRLKEAQRLVDHHWMTITLAPLVAAARQEDGVHSADEAVKRAFKLYDEIHEQVTKRLARGETK